MAVSLFLSLLWSGCKNSDEVHNPIIPAPTITEFSPTSGSAGTSVTITGTNFSTAAANNVVMFNGTTATVSAATGTSLTVSVPAGASSGKITVGVSSQTVSSATHFTIVQAPTISGLSPDTGAEGATVTITGVNFSASIINNLVRFNGALALVTAATTTRLTVIVPEDGSTGKVTVQVGSQTAISAEDFVYGATKTVSTLAGSGLFGFADGTGTAAQFNHPIGIALDAAGNIYVTDAENNRIRKVTSTGTVTTLAGDGTAGSADGDGTAARFLSPRGVVLDASGNLYIADGINNRIRKITPTGTVTTLAGSGTRGSTDGNGVSAQFDFPKGIAIDASGNLYVADDLNARIRKVTPTGTVSTLAGSTLGFADGVGTAAQFNRPTGVAVDAAGNVYVADSKNHRIRKITSTGEVSTLAGSTEGIADGLGTAAKFSEPVGVAVDASGNVYVTDSDNNRIRKITPDGSVTTTAGGTLGGFTDGPAATARFNSPSGVAVDASGHIYLSDRLNNRIRKIQ